VSCLFAWGRHWVQTPLFWLQHGWCEWAQCWWRFPTFLLSMFKKSIIITHNLCDCLTQGHGIKHGQQWVFHISTKSKLKLAHECNFIPWNVTCYLSKFRSIHISWVWSLVKSLQLACCYTFFVWIAKRITNFF